MRNSLPKPVPPAPLRVLEPVPPEPSMEVVPPAVEPLMACYRVGENVIVENGAPVPTAICIRSGRPSCRTLEITLRNPADPRTWFGPRPRLEVGLCRKYYEDHFVAVALTWSVLAVGAIMLTAGLLSHSAVTAVVGFLAMGVSGFFRATSPVTSPDATATRATLVGAGPIFRNHLPDRSGD